jgi:ketosteroid isomerase-like protein
MSQEAVELARAAYERLARGDFALAAELPEDFELVLAPEMPDAGSYRGESARRWLQSWVESFDRLSIEPVAFTDAGDRVVVEFIQRGWSGGAKAPVELRTWDVLIVRDGTLRRSELFVTRAEALEAAGLSE